MKPIARLVVQKQNHPTQPERLELVLHDEDNAKATIRQSIGKDQRKLAELVCQIINSYEAPKEDQ